MSKTTILIVVTKTSVASDLTARLEKLGYEIAGIASRGEEAVEKAQQACPNLVLTEVHLGNGMDGIETAETIRQFRDVPVLYLTSHIDSTIMDHTSISDSFNYILMPIDEHSLKLQVESALRKHQSELLLRQQVEFLQETLNAIGDGVVSVDDQGDIISINPVAESLTGWTAREATGRPAQEVFRIIDEGSGREIEDTLTRALREGELVSLTSSAALKTRDGRVLSVEKKATPIMAADGRVLGAVLVMKDVTEQRRAEQALAESEQRLKRSQEIAHLGSWELDLVNNELTWSDEVYRIFGLEPQQFDATYDAFLAHVHPDDRQAVHDAYTGSIRKKHDAYEIAHRVIRSNTGEIRYVHEKCIHIRNEQGAIVRSIGMVLDITERRRAEERVRQLAHFPEENPNIVLRCTVEGKIVYSNNPARRWLATLGQPVEGKLPPVVLETVTRACAEGAVVETEVTNIQGRTFGLFGVQPAGEAYINIYGIDLTERKRALEDLARSNRDLEQVAYVALPRPAGTLAGYRRFSPASGKQVWGSARPDRAALYRPGRQSRASHANPDQGIAGPLPGKRQGENV